MTGFCSIREQYLLISAAPNPVIVVVFRPARLTNSRQKTGDLLSSTRLDCCYDSGKLTLRQDDKVNAIRHAAPASELVLAISTGCTGLRLTICFNELASVASNLHFSQPRRREESRRGRHECLRYGAKYTLSYGIAAQTSRLPLWQSDRLALRNIVGNTAKTVGHHASGQRSGQRACNEVSSITSIPVRKPTGNTL
ncbi:MAG TPA: hypothetical protein VK789_24525 [Bryobacteraceae bacterium]|nr:hypothetical protein [Bryobacteraceae bacterium]